MTTTDNGFRIVLCTTGSDEQAESIARALVERRLAACVNIVGGTCSVYRWKDEVVRDAEKLLVIKTTAATVERVREAIHELHSYDTPEVLSIAVSEGDPAYLDWIAKNVD
ncbi:divalent-cation tolerance protein CutA [bacterium]|nr:divalent-cation tolerance protein CutA [bacterium]